MLDINGSDLVASHDEKNKQDKSIPNRVDNSDAKHWRKHKISLNSVREDLITKSYTLKLYFV